MTDFVARLFGRAEPAVSTASSADAAAMAALHSASFHRGWSDAEFEQLLLDRNVVIDRATSGRNLAGFIISRIAGDEAEILSIAVASSWRGKGIAARLLNVNMRRLAGLGTRAIFLEVGDDNIPARRLYRRAGFNEVARREGYYRDRGGNTSTALVLRRDLA